MPLDNKRINGPEITLPYQLFDKLNTKSLKQRFREAVEGGTRKDGRKLDEHRKIFLKTDVVTQAKGSAYIEVDNTKVIVSVFDPREIPNKNEYSAKGEIFCEFKYAPFSCNKRRLHQQDSEELQYSAIMKQALEAVVFRHEFPNFQVDIYAMVLHNDGAALSAAITAAGAALAHAGIPMYDLICSVSLAIQGDTILIDPTLEEEDLCSIPIFKDEGKDEHGLVLIAQLATHQQISQFHQSGFLGFDTINSCIDLLMKQTDEITLLIKKCLVTHVVNTVKNVED